MEFKCDVCGKRNIYRGTKSQLSRGTRLRCSGCSSWIQISKSGNGKLKAESRAAV